jgi:hypothetical protein
VREWIRVLAASALRAELAHRMGAAVYGIRMPSSGFGGGQVV